MVNIRKFRSKLRVFEQFLGNQLQDCCCGVTVAQCHCLFAIEDLGQTTIGELAEFLRLDKSTLSRTVDNLVRLGYVSRESDLVDRRSFRISLTKSGHQKVEEMHNVNDAYFLQVFEHIPEPDQDNVAKHLIMFVDAIKQFEGSQETADICCEEE
ncbi:MAG: MarR family transcriptional regulator [Chloroflexota bacterium]|nr:MAG: MarR family transcriptional regulator [Chloroflexota bacterium]